MHRIIFIVRGKSNSQKPTVMMIIQCIEYEKPFSASGQSKYITDVGVVAATEYNCFNS